MPENVRYFKLSEDVGIEPDYLTDPKTGEPVENPRAGELGPLIEVKITVPTPAMAGDEPIVVPQDITLPDPRYGVIADAEARVLKIHDPIVAEQFATHDLYREVEPLKSDQPRKPKAPADKE